MVASSAWAVPYEIRPSKQVERRLVLETLLVARECGIAIRDLPFVGMGGVRFVDMLLAHKVVGMTRFTSLEHDDTLWNRCELNKPFEAMTIYRGSAAEYLAEHGFSEASVVWFDIERMVSKDASDDITSLATGVKPGSFVFVTATAQMPSELMIIKGKDRRLRELKDRFGPFADRLRLEWLGQKDFHQASAHLALRMMKFGFQGRADGAFVPLINLAYRDTTWMATVGGFFGDEGMGRKIRKHLRETLPFLPGKIGECPFVLEQFNITDAERLIFDRSCYSKPRARKHRQELRRLGFRQSVIDQYQDVVRFIPRYVESAL